MQSLWSRAGQAHRCGCRACSTVVGAFGKRATTATRRKPTFAELFTACYSSMFATAAIVDAVRKDDRRRELDRQLEEARRELTDLKVRGNSEHMVSDSATTDLTTQQMDVLWRSLKSIYKGRPYMKEIDKPATLSASELLSSLKDERYQSPAEAYMRAARRTDYEQLERAIISEETNESIVHRDSLNHVHLTHESSSIERLVQQLMRRADAIDKSSKPSPSFDETKDMVQNGYPNHTFRSIDAARAQENTSILNKRLRSLVTDRKLGLKERVGRICYNLLVSAHPADMHTYNTLIVAFDKAGQHALAGALVHSFFHDQLLKPTPSTFVAILNHYKDTNNHGKFLRALACITGLDDKTGAKIGRRHVDDIEMNPILQRWAADTRSRTQTGDYVWEHVPLHKPLIEAVLGGLLHFKLFDDAAKFFLTCMRTGTALSSGIVKQLLDECIVALDWRAAVRLVRGFTNLQTKWRSLLLAGDEKATSHLIARTHALLDLCGIRISGTPASEACLDNLKISGLKLDRFLETLDGVSSSISERSVGKPRNVYLEDAGSRSASRLLQVESMLKECIFIRNSTMSVESKLLYPDFSPEFRISMALYIGGSARRTSMQLSQEFQELMSSSKSKGYKTQRLLEECDSLRVDDHAEANQAPLKDAKNIPAGWADKIIQGRRNIIDETHIHDFGSASSLPEISGGSRQERGTAPEAGLRATGRGRLAWPVVAEERAYYSEERRWAVGV